MIFSRRSIQRMIDDVRLTVGHNAMGRLLGKLNRPDENRLAAVWEVALLAQFDKIGELRYEHRLPSGTRPDINLTADRLHLTADITTVSDKGLDALNPYVQLDNILHSLIRDLGLGPGGLHLEVDEWKEETPKGLRRRLRLPAEKHLQSFVDTRIAPELTRQRSIGQWPLTMKIDDEIAGLSIKVSEGPYSSGSYGSYDVPTSLENNPLWKAIDNKAGQLRDAPGIVGVIVCDGDCQCIRNRSPASGRIRFSKSCHKR